MGNYLAVCDLTFVTFESAQICTQVFHTVNPLSKGHLQLLTHHTLLPVQSTFTDYIPDNDMVVFWPRDNPSPIRIICQAGYSWLVTTAINMYMKYPWLHSLGIHGYGKSTANIPNLNLTISRRSCKWKRWILPSSQPATSWEESGLKQRALTSLSQDNLPNWVITG